MLCLLTIHFYHFLDLSEDSNAFWIHANEFSNCLPLYPLSPCSFLSSVFMNVHSCSHTHSIFLLSNKNKDYWLMKKKKKHLIHLLRISIWTDFPDSVLKVEGCIRPQLNFVPFKVMHGLCVHGEHGVLHSDGNGCHRSCCCPARLLILGRSQVKNMFTLLHTVLALFSHSPSSFFSNSFFCGQSL